MITGMHTMFYSSEPAVDPEHRFHVLGDLEVELCQPYCRRG